MGAWIETESDLNEIDQLTSHPMWVRGLKQSVFDMRLVNGLSHPMWVRGLKLCGKAYRVKLGQSHPMWVRGLKHTVVQTD